MKKKIFAVVLCLLLFVTTWIPADGDFGVGTHDYFHSDEEN